VSALAAAGVAIENARLYEETVSREAWLRAAATSTAALTTGDDVEEGLGHVAEAVRVASGADAVAVLRSSPEERGEPWVQGSALELWAYAGRERPRAAEPLLPAHLAEALRGRNALEPDVDEVGALLASKPPQSAMALPLWAVDRLLAVVVLAWGEEGRTVSSADISQASAFSEQVALALAVAEAQADRERLAVLEDRDRIARDLHDLVIQRLFAVGLSVQAAARDAVRPAIRGRLEQVVDDLDDTIKDVRRTIFQLQAGPGQAGLRAEVDEVLEDAEEALGFAPALHTVGPLSAVPDDVAADLTAVLREALTNVAKHAHATTAAVSLTVGGAVEACVTDNGVGLPAGPGRRSGLANLGARAQAHGGTCTAVADPDGGTVLTWRVPLTSGGRET
jgi:signal transduction histidine kinase